MWVEKAILKTLAYADIFDYPLKAWEIHKWLVGKKSSLSEVEKALKRDSLVLKVKSREGFYFLKGRKSLVKKRMARERQSAKYLRQARLIARLFKGMPSVKLVGISGNLAMENSEKSDDIDLFIITSKNKLWLTRLSLLLILSLIGKRRERGDSRPRAAGKICVNLLLEEDNLAQKNKDLYTAHEVLQMRVLWQRGDVYSKFLEQNDWAFKFLPNWTSGRMAGRSAFSLGVLSAPVSQVCPRKLRMNTLYLRSTPESSPTLPPRGNYRGFYTSALGEGLEFLVKNLQLRYMGRPEGKERIMEGALYFHPEDYREKILREFGKRLAKLKVK